LAGYGPPDTNRVSGANLPSVHLLLDGRLLKTLPSRYHPEQLVRLAQLPGAQPAGRRQGHRLSA